MAKWKVTLVEPYGSQIVEADTWETRGEGTWICFMMKGIDATALATFKAENMVSMVKL